MKRTKKVYKLPDYWRRLTALLICCTLLTPPCFAIQARKITNKLEPLHTAEILGVGAEVERLLYLKSNPGSNSEESIYLRTVLLRRILRGVLEVRQYCNMLELERAYAYDIMQKEQRRQAFVGQLFTLASFSQLATFYTMEPYMRMREQFVTSAVFTTVSGSLNTGISTLSRLHGFVAKASNVAPPAVLGNLVTGGPVDTRSMPQLLDRYFDFRLPGAKESRRDELFAHWLNQYKIDASNPENLCALAGKKKASLSMLRSRVLLLWSLRTAVIQFDHDLLALLRLIGEPIEVVPVAAGGYSGDNGEVVRFLGIGPHIEELNRLKQGGQDAQRINELEVFVLQKTLEGTLEIQAAADKVDEDLYYNYHIVLSDLESSRARSLQLNSDANFLQSGILGIVAGKLYLSRHTFAGDQMFVISGSNGTALTLLAALQQHGFWRKSDTGPNSLAQLLNLHPQEDYKFSSFVTQLLNSPPPGSVDGKSRLELLNESWRKSHVTTLKLDSSKNQRAVAAMPPHKYDTIKIVKNRINLLHSLMKELESFQNQTLSVLNSTDAKEILPTVHANIDDTGLSKHASEAARLLGIEEQVKQVLALKAAGKLQAYDDSGTRLQLQMLRRVQTTGLQLRVLSAQFDREINAERQALDRVTRERDLTVALLNDANFLQLGILATIIDGPLGITKKKKLNLYGDRLNIVSGLTVGGLAGLSLVAQRGGFRHTKSGPNLLGQTFGLPTPESEQLPAVLSSYMNSVPPLSESGLTRREQLISYWKSTKILPISISKTANVERVSGYGSRHHRWCETIKLMNARISMLFDLRAMVDRLNVGLVELLKAID